MLNGPDIWDIISGVLGLAMPFVARSVYHQFPSYKFRTLDDTLRETESLLSSSLEDGLVPDGGVAAKFMERAERYVPLPVLLFSWISVIADCPSYSPIPGRLRDRTERVRPEVYLAKTNWQQLKGIGSGLTKMLSMLSDDVLTLRAEISVSPRYAALLLRL